jgi:hypothetical protein
LVYLILIYSKEVETIGVGSWSIGRGIVLLLESSKEVILSRLLLLLLVLLILLAESPKEISANIIVLSNSSQDRLLLENIFKGISLVIVVLGTTLEGIVCCIASLDIHFIIIHETLSSTNIACQLIAH